MLLSLTRPLPLLSCASVTKALQRLSTVYGAAATVGASLVRSSLLRHPSVVALLHHVLRGLAGSAKRTAAAHCKPSCLGLCNSLQA